MVFVLVEHRDGEIRDITFEMLRLAWDIKSKDDKEKVTAILFAEDTEGLFSELDSWADEVLTFADPKLKNFNADVYRQLLESVIKERNPKLIILGHTAQGINLAPAVSADLGIPLVTSVRHLERYDGGPIVMRTMYGEKINSDIKFKKRDQYMITLQAGSFAIDESPGATTEMVEMDLSINDDDIFQKFLGFIEPEIGEVDISSSEFLVAVGRGIGEKANMDIIEELADLLNADICCSRPVIDNGWLSKDRQVGQSGKYVKPKLYVAVGISGALQHTIGIKGGTIVAINKDAQAPIFKFADYGIVGDLFDVVPALVDKLKES